MRPAGHTSTTQEKEYLEVDDKLARIFTDWLNNLGRSYKTAERILRSFTTIPLSHTHSLTFSNIDHPNLPQLEYLIAAIHNHHTQETTITYNLHTPKLNIGNLLPQHKTLINNGTTQYSGWKATGTIINNSITQYLGWYATGLTINQGTTQHLGWLSKGTLINNGTITDGLGYKATGTLINNGTVTEALGCRAKGLIINNGAITEYLGYKATGTLISKQKPHSTFKGNWYQPTQELIQYLNELKQHPEHTPTQKQLLQEIKKLIPELQ